MTHHNTSAADAYKGWQQLVKQYSQPDIKASVWQLINSIGGIVGGGVGGQILGAVLGGAAPEAGGADIGGIIGSLAGGGVGGGVVLAIISFVRNKLGK